MRLGELLCQKGLITPEQLKTSLHEQTRFGGRLGTNLIQLGYVAMDTIALALSEQQSLPAVLREHVASVDKKTLALFPARMVTTHKAIPIGYTLTKPGRVVVAAMDPAKLPLEELAFAAGRRIEVWIAPEALVQECFERYFGAAPVPNRYLAMKVPNRAVPSQGALRAAKAPESRPEPAPTSTATPARAAQPKASVPSKASARSAGRGLSPPPPPPPPVVTRTLEMPEMPAARPPVAPVLEMPVMVAPSWGLELPVQEPSTEPSTPQSARAMEEQAHELPGEDDWDADEESAPARLSQVPPEDIPLEERPVTAPPEALRPVIDRTEASQMLELATSKDQVGRVLEDWLRSTFGCGLVLVVKGDMAIGWKGFFSDAEELIEAVAIPLAKPSMFATAYESRAPFRGAPPAEGAKVQELLWKLLRCAPPADAVVLPITLGKRAVNLLYAHMDDGSKVADGVAEDATALASEAARAYARLIGKEREKR